MGGRRDLGVWIDVESVTRSGVKLLNKNHVWEAKRELEARGYYVPGIYSGAWYWEYMPGGEPSMEGLGYLWVSNYGQNRSGAPQTTYTADGGNQHRGWGYPLGDRKPDILQFGSNGRVAGWHPVDVNAYKGTRDQLAAIFTPPTQQQPQGEDTDMNHQQADEMLHLLRAIAEDVAQCRHQLRGDRDAGWEQLGKNRDGQNLSLVDGVAATRRDIAALRTAFEIKGVI